jgi:hypothetical protein
MSRAQVLASVSAILPEEPTPLRPVNDFPPPSPARVATRGRAPDYLTANGTECSVGSAPARKLRLYLPSDSPLVLKLKM